MPFGAASQVSSPDIRLAFSARRTTASRLAPMRGAYSGAEQRPAYFTHHPDVYRRST
jgi:hypothetical protein